MYDSWTFNAFVNRVADKRGVLRGGLDTPGFVTCVQPRTFRINIRRDLQLLVTNDCTSFGALRARRGGGELMTIRLASPSRPRRLLRIAITSN